MPDPLASSAGACGGRGGRTRDGVQEPVLRLRESWASKTPRAATVKCVHVSFVVVMCLDPQSKQNDSPKPLKVAQRSLILHKFGGPDKHVVFCTLPTCCPHVTSPFGPSSLQFALEQAGLIARMAQLKNARSGLHSHLLAIQLLVALHLSPRHFPNQANDHMDTFKVLYS